MKKKEKQSHGERKLRKESSQERKTSREPRLAARSGRHAIQTKTWKINATSFRSHGQLNFCPKYAERSWKAVIVFRRDFWVRGCRWESDTLTLYQTMSSCIFRPYSRLDAKKSNPIADLLVSRNFISVAVSCLYGKWYRILDQNSLISVLCPRLYKLLKTLSFTAANLPIYLVYQSSTSNSPWRNGQTKVICR